MFDIRKIQEQVIYEAVKAESDAATAGNIIGSSQEEDAVWVKNTMKRLEDCFDQPTLRKIRRNCVTWRNKRLRYGGEAGPVKGDYEPDHHPGGVRQP